MKIVTAAETREIDRLTSERFGVPALTLMENAGTAVAEVVLAEYPSARRLGIICGKGNNGGDGFVAARKLHEAGREVQVLLLADPSELRGDAAEMFKRLPVSPIFAKSGDDLKSERARAVFEADVLVDAILGTGFRPPVRGLYAEAIAAINASSAPVIAVDIPSGADADVMGEQTGAVARADAVVTFTAPRPAHVFGLVANGPILVAPIGSPDDAIVSDLRLNVTTAKDIAPLIGPRPAAANKGDFGHVLVIGGSLGKAGAAAMAGMSALRAGAGLSTVATPKSVLPTVAGFHPELMTEPLEETGNGTISLRALDYERLDALVEHKTVLAIGPGISRSVETAEVVHTVVNRYKVPMVVDADGLNAFQGCTEKLDGGGRPLVITPHPGEMARLVGSTAVAVQRDRLQVARTFAREHNLIVVLKGHRTLIAQPDATVWVNTTGNPGMATGGTGDILTGMIAGFIAQNPMRVFEAVIAAVHLHGLAGDIARETMGEQSLVATDLVKTLPEAIRRARRNAQEKLAKICG
ncbi:MAG: bifunctional ADP-dependent NAD(P)H-hydrate dehydratase/NAD(P)H-hydrate epimerase [Acidobacteria bacterium]|nr:MAG: bifunctional ADP-dependent NAD(P)H-hydrate dehydratase/NAD(P)H-hydrate epimerase [Acidobacteriota bacterium]